MLCGLDAAGYELGAQEQRDARSYHRIHGARELLARWGSLLCRVLQLAPAGAPPELLKLPRKPAVPLDEATWSDMVAAIAVRSLTLMTDPPVDLDRESAAMHPLVQQLAGLIERRPGTTSRSPMRQGAASTLSSP